MHDASLWLACALVQRSRRPSPLPGSTRDDGHRPPQLRRLLLLGAPLGRHRLLLLHAPLAATASGPHAPRTLTGACPGSRRLRPTLAPAWRLP